MALNLTDCGFIQLKIRLSGEFTPFWKLLNIISYLHKSVEIIFLFRYIFFSDFSPFIFSHISRSKDNFLISKQVTNLSQGCWAAAYFETFPVQMSFECSYRWHEKFSKVYTIFKHSFSLKLSLNVYETIFSLKSFASTIF